MQAKLLRVIEQAEIKRLGGETSVRVDVRLLAATRRDLRQLVATGAFRDDLYFRLAVASIELPPLRRRTGEVSFLARVFWRELGGSEEALPVDLLQRLEAHAWPGNVRELRNAVSREMALGDLAEAGLATPGDAGPSLSAAVPDLVDGVLARGLPLAASRELILAEFERRYLENALQEAKGDLDLVAERAGVGLRYLRMLRAKSRA